jgi:DNA-binding transcriptional LysR family regulator
MDRLTSMAVFVRAVELGSFAAAGNALDLSGPMVGKHIRSLEERLGVRLISRTTRRQSLTGFGSAYYERCRAILADVEMAETLAADHMAEPRGKLRVTMPVHFGRHCVAPILLELARQYPALELELSFNDRLSDLAEDGFDLAIRTGIPADSSDLVARRIARQTMVVCAAPRYIQAHGLLEGIEDLGKHQAVVYRRSGPVQPWLFPSDGPESVKVLPLYRLCLDDLDAIADAATTGIGLAWLPYWLVHERILANTLVQLFPEQPGHLYDVYALWLQAQQLPFRVRLAVEALAAQLPGRAQLISDTA